MRRTAVHPPSAFTLIELLIVIAIIAILALIAVPNFIEAQVRAKVSRCKADLRSLATGLEAYCVDHNAYPPYGRITSHTPQLPFTPVFVIQYPATANDMADLHQFVGRGLTTPIAYLTALPRDPFALSLERHPDDPTLVLEFEYLNMRQHVSHFPPPPRAAWMDLLLPGYGEWRVVAAGPDGDRGADARNNILYDPTNGTVSDGDIIRCQHHSEQEPVDF